MAARYEPHEVEGRIMQRWLDRSAFRAAADDPRPAYVIAIPPPNVTGSLHMGHALNDTIQDILIRYHHLRGFNTLWVVGTDHAGIATQNKVEGRLAAEGLRKEDIGREAFEERVWEWRREYGSTIIHQLKKLGCACDYDHERFTMDEAYQEAVAKVFVALYEKGDLYRDIYLVNWCVRCGSAISDLEVEHEDRASKLYYVKYPVAGSDETLTVATTRPETILGDTAVAVNPKDPRYGRFVGKTAVVPMVGREVPIIADEHVDIGFGTGALKITPGHDPDDWEIGLRHGLPSVSVIGLDGLMTAEAGEFAGMTASDARTAVIERLERDGLFVKAEDYQHAVGTCYRCGTTIEPLLSLQWFMDMGRLVRPAIKAVEEGRVRFVPARWGEVYLDWMRGIRPWCISRQLWWGHRIPAYFCEACDHLMVAAAPPASCDKCGGSLRREEDVLDTWFSSALWPFATLGWPDKTRDLDAYYPTNTLVTGYDIIFFWVSRMIFSGLHHTGQAPFDTVLINGIVRDEQGRKMSKSLGNGVDPLELIDTYGADALRFSLIQGVAPGADMRLSTERSEAARNFANKIWNASRYVLMNLTGEAGRITPALLNMPEKWVLSRLNRAIRAVTDHLHGNDLGLAAQVVYDFAWNEFCDWYIELSKGDLFDGDAQRKVQSRAVLYAVLSALLRLLHPFMPFLTETIYSSLPGHEGLSCMLADWPQADPAWDFPQEEQAMEGVMDMIRAIRVVRQELKVQPGHKARVLLKPNPGWAERLATAEPYFQRLAGAASLSLLQPEEAPDEKTVSAVGVIGEALMPLGDLVDLDKEIARLEKEAQTLRDEIARSQGKLANKGFVSKAPPALVTSEKEKITQNTAMLETFIKRLEELRR